jgi:hypothetical protein
MWISKRFAGLRYAGNLNLTESNRIDLDQSNARNGVIDSCCRPTFIEKATFITLS